MDTDDWSEAGLYDPDAAGADERRTLLRSLAERGATIEQMTDAHRVGRLPAVAGDLIMGGAPATVSVREVAERCGVPVERVQRVLLASGLPVAADDRLREDVVALVVAFEQGAALMGDEAVIAFTRARYQRAIRAMSTIGTLIRNTEPHQYLPSR